MNVVIIVYIRVLQSRRRGCEEVREHELVDAGASVSQLKPRAAKEMLWIENKSSKKTDNSPQQGLFLTLRHMFGVKGKDLRSLNLQILISITI